MSIVEQLEAAGEILSPAVRGALVALEARLHALEEENGRLRPLAALVEQLRAVVEQLEARLRELEARLGQNSTNSFRPPSSDPPGTHPPGKKRRRGTRRGGQPGHPGAFRTLLPPERVDRVVEHRREQCAHCGAALEGAEVVGCPVVQPVVELPPVRAEVTEHRAPTLVCPACGQLSRAALPSEVVGHRFGPRLVGFALLMLSRFHLSRRALVAFLSDLLDVPAPALGTTERFCAEARSALRRSSLGAAWSLA